MQTQHAMDKLAVYVWRSGRCHSKSQCGQVAGPQATQPAQTLDTRSNLRRWLSPGLLQCGQVPPASLRLARKHACSSETYYEMLEIALISVAAATMQRESRWPARSLTYALAQQLRRVLPATAHSQVAESACSWLGSRGRGCVLPLCPLHLGLRQRSAACVCAS